MTITPFPPRELAKLVLGYLAEEQLMTAYDEFLQGSPYLDALENEHDRVFMTPLRNIVAEYRALKIYVETCKPFALRRRLMDCTNLLEAVKLLVHLVDTKKINWQEHGPSRLGYDSVNTKAYSRDRSLCDVCSSLNHINCACHILSKSNASVDATLLKDLPGHSGRKKYVKVLDKDKTSSSMSSNEQFSLSSKNIEKLNTGDLDQDVVLVDTPTLQRQDNDCNSDGQSHNIHSVTREPSNTSQKTDNTHTTLSNVTNSSQYNSGMSSGHGDRHSPVTGTFQDFAAGFDGKNTVPDSSTSESINSVVPVTNEDNTHKGISGNYTTNKKEVTNAHILLKVEIPKSSTSSQTNSGATNINTTDLKQNHSLRPTQTEQKITILSDIKVDKGFTQSDDGGGIRAPAVLRHASTPRALHTVLINGTRAFSRELPHGVPHAYTRDEIMAMPTIILVPASFSAAGQSQNPNNVYVQPTNTETASVSSTARSLGPLLIDVDSSDSAKSKVKVQTAEPTVKLKNQSDMSKSKVLELNNEGSILTAKAAEFKNATVPKDAEASNKSTPVSVPLPRKSSSTPRRSGHVRVLDFTTPRRILSETIPEHPPPAPDATTATQHPPVEMILTKSPSLYAFANQKEANVSDKSTALKLDSVNKNEECAIATQSIQKIITVKKSDWDADLRALAVANAKLDTPRPKAKSSRRKKGSENKRDVEKSQEKKTRKKSNVTKSTTKIKFKSLEVIEDSVEIVEPSIPAHMPVKPTINIITEHDWGTIPATEDPDTNKNNDDETDTPEMERLSLQNAIGVKLNISDLLETPFKQALYDIQMETPKFLGPDLPGDPMSDIKIMNIPTPRFLNTPKPPQATPSSYSSRQTDYSSGGSYYKPDDQDYIDVGYPVPPPKEIPLASEDLAKNKSTDKVFKSSRPVRKCTKNVSYANSPNIKAKEGDKANASGSSESSLNEPAPPTNDKSVKKCKTPKTETKRKSIGIKKRKTPAKKETPKLFMKIKPRRPTPVKDSVRKRKQSGTPGRKSTVGRDKIVSDTLAVEPAPTKSRRKSSTPRKLHCTKHFHSESSGHESPEMLESKNVPTRASSGSGVPDSDAEPPPLHWSDEGTQDAAPTHASTKPRLGAVNDTEDITKIQEYLAESEPLKSLPEHQEGNLHIDLVRRGFDVETAKIIERDLLDTPPHPKENATSSNVGHIVADANKDNQPPHPKENATSSNVGRIVADANKDNQAKSSTGEKGQFASNISVHVAEDGAIEDDIVLTVHECNENSENYIACHHDDCKDIPKRAPEKLKDKFSMEVCIDDDVAIRLRATPLIFLIDENSKEEESNRETEMAVSSISGMAKLYTPLKEQRAQVYEIFDSTLTSLDTPLKVDTPRRTDSERTVTEIVLEVEKGEKEDNVEIKTRKRPLSRNSSDESTSENKRPKPAPPYLLNPPNIKNIDIETVLCKLHGP